MRCDFTLGTWTAALSQPRINFSQCLDNVPSKALASASLATDIVLRLGHEAPWLASKRLEIFLDSTVEIS